MKPWWQADPGILANELDALEKNGIDHEIDEDAKANGVLIISMRYPFRGELVQLTAIYPNEFPYFPPQVFAPDSDFALHQNPINRQLCMLGNRTQEWKPSFTVLDHINERFPELVNDNESPKEPVEPQAAPASGFFRYDGDPSSISIDGEWNVASGQGRATLKTRAIHATDGRLVLQGLVAKLRMGSNNRTLKWSGSIPGFFNSELDVPIVRVGKPDYIDDAAQHLNTLSVMFPTLRKRIWHENAGGAGPKIAMVGITYEEEIAPGETGPGWQFFLTSDDQDGEKVRRVRALRAGPADIGIRVPAVQILRDKKILLAGCGAVGGPIACELARNATRELRLLDHDFVEPGPTVRWPLGIQAYGFAKSQQLAEFIEANYPFCQVKSVLTRIGWSPDCPEETDLNERHLKCLDEALDGVDLIIDATAEVAVQYYLSTHAFKHDIPYIYASATPGAAGGLVGRFLPGDPDGCWYCLQLAMHGVDSVIAPPPADDESDVLPAGCSHTTFSGAGFDLQEVSLQAVRMAVKVFGDDATNAFARLAFDRELGLPRWTASDIPCNATCPVCQKPSG